MLLLLHALIPCLAAYILPSSPVLLHINILPSAPVLLYIYTVLVSLLGNVYTPLFHCCIETVVCVYIKRLITAPFRSGCVGAIPT